MIYRQLGETSAQALHAIKARHGADVVVIATHETAAGVEVVFTLDAGDGFSAGLPSVRASTSQRAERVSAQSVVAQQTAPTSEHANLTERQRLFPGHAPIEVTLREAGFSPAGAAALLQAVPPGLSGDAALRKVLEGLQLHLHARCAASEWMDTGGVHALVGPTGAGKTTTVAKLAVRCLAAHGKGSVSIVTTDTYRIGAVEQLKIYGRVLGVDVHVAASVDALQKRMDEQRNVHLMLVDTMGLSPRDGRIATLVQGFDTLGIHKHLVLPAAIQTSVQQDVVARFRGDGLASCILTKLDEAAELGGTLDTVLRHALPLSYCSVGQRVPEDLHRVDPVYLAHQALPEAMAGLFRLDEWMARWKRWGLLPSEVVAQTPAPGDVTL